jgi:prepilin-type processing-associated H-X9-DG protein
VVGHHEYCYDAERVGKYLQAAGAEVMKCPADPGARRSYAMNIWACSRVSAGGQIADWMQTHGRPWNMETTQGSRLMLIVESWSGIGSESFGWSATAVVGWQGETPGQRFGAGGGIEPPVSAGRWGPVRSELPYSRHRLSGSGSALEPAGRVHIGYADGHVALKSESDLADFATGRSTLGSLWSPLDPEYNR